MSRLLTAVADLAGYAEPGTAQMELDILHIAREYAELWQNSTHSDFFIIIIIITYEYFTLLE